MKWKYPTCCVDQMPVGTIYRIPNPNPTRPRSDHSDPYLQKIENDLVMVLAQGWMPYPPGSTYSPEGRVECEVIEWPEDDLIGIEAGYWVSDER